MEEEKKDIQDINKDTRPRPEVEGVLDIAEGGFGFLRFENYQTSDDDIYVSPAQVRRFNMKTGDKVKGISRLPNEGEKFGALLYVNTVNGEELSKSIHRPDFRNLTPIFPDERLMLSENSSDIGLRLIDLVAPVGKGQRSMIVSPPKTGKTTLLTKIASSIEKNYEETEVIVLLIDERPEEVTAIRRELTRSDVIASTFDKKPQNHVKVAEMVLARAEGLAEYGKDVVILLDSITRLARAYNLVIPPSGRTLSGGLDPSALHKPKRFFGAARNIEEGGSITIIATALVDTGSRMDDVIFEEFKGTGNSELKLDRSLAEKRIFPAIDVEKSGTRKEELILSKEELEVMWTLRKSFRSKGGTVSTKKLIEGIRKTENNKEYIERIQKVIKNGNF